VSHPKKIPDKDIDFIMNSELNGVMVANILGCCQRTVSKYRINGGYKKEFRGYFRAKNIKQEKKVYSGDFFTSKLV